MISTNHALIQSSESQFNEQNKGNGGVSEKAITFRMKQVLYLHMAGESPEDIAEQLGYSSRFAIYNVLRNPKIRALQQEIMDYYDDRFRQLYPEVIESVKSALRSADEKVQLEASKIWLKSHGKLESRQEQQAPSMTIESLVANILVQARNENDPGSPSNRELISDTRQTQTNRRFQTQPESEKV